MKKNINLNTNENANINTISDSNVISDLNIISDSNTATSLDTRMAINFKMPRYNSIPNVGLYLEQVVKYVNECLAPLDISVTPSMLSNYVKKGYISRPIKKQYYADQIAYVLFIIIAKQSLSMENVSALFSYQKSTYSVEIAYNFFCDELENMLLYIFEINEEPPAASKDDPFAKKTLRSVVIAVSHIIYLNYCFKNKLAEY